MEIRFTLKFEACHPRSSIHHCQSPIDIRAMYPTLRGFLLIPEAYPDKVLIELPFLSSRENYVRLFRPEMRRTP